MIYELLLTFHLLCACVLIGFCFSLTFIIPVFDKDIRGMVYKKAALKRGVVLIPLVVVCLALSGLILLGIKQNINLFLISKIFLSLFVFAGISYWVYAKKKRFSPSLCFLKSFRIFSPLASMVISCLGLASIYFG